MKNLSILLLIVLVCLLNISLVQYYRNSLPIIPPLCADF